MNKTATEEFPKECAMLLRYMGCKPTDCIDGKNHWRLPLEFDSGVEPEDGDLLSPSDFEPYHLLVAALRWLAGRKMQDVTVFARLMPPDGDVWYYWPNDPLTILLEEVRAQLKEDNDEG